MKLSHLSSENANLYLQRYAHPLTLIDEPPSTSLGIVVVIPCYNEPHLIDALNSLYQCQPVNENVEIIVVINQPRDCSSSIKEQNKNSYQQALEWTSTHNSKQLMFHVVYADDLPPKDAGVGLARKIGMDEAVRRFDQLNNHQQGIIVGFDADCTTAPNYFKEILNLFRQHRQVNGCSIFFEHTLDNYDSIKTTNAIVLYEIHLRYYIQALRFAGFPYAYQTLGSCMAVRSSVYQKQGGMNKRKAGEDFYFLNKIIALGNFVELNTTTVYPSGRASDRVPFGTGKAVKDQLRGRNISTYHPAIFQDLQKFISSNNQFFKTTSVNVNNILSQLPKSVQTYLEKVQFINVLQEINHNCARLNTFQQKFFQWFNGLKVLQYIHHSRDHFYANLKVEEAAYWLLKEKFNINVINSDPREILTLWRKIDRS
ncbi:MAG: glycosyltransferase [Bacteroidetes bacterium]|nr:glycosyltransferase [Bacteroidota bacterium]